MTLRILHTADIHLDAPFKFLSEKGAVHRRQIRETFASITRMAAAEHYDLLLIAGDLFDDNHPSRDTQHFVDSELRALPLPVCILPGNHDLLDGNSVYHHLELSPNVHVLKDRPSYIEFSELNLTVAGSPIHGRYDDTHQLDNIVRSESTRWFVAMAHGNMQVPGLLEVGSRPIKPAALAATGADYVALGDWHAFADHSVGSVKAYYSGAPEPTAVSQTNTGAVASITLSDQGIQVEPKRVGRVEARTLELDVTGQSESALIQTIRVQANRQCMLNVKLKGLKSADELLNLADIYEATAGDFYWLKVDDEAALDPQAIDPTDFPEDFVIGQYARLLAERIENAVDERERRIAERALQMGVALLNGQKVL